jgi:uncharacterized membrane protein
MTAKPLNDERVEALIANLLRTGVVIAALVVIGGAVPYLAAHPWAHVTYRAFQGEPDELKAVSGIVRNAFSGDPRGIMQLGLLLLIATPIARVVFSAGAFAVEGDRMYVGFTLFVLAVLLYSLFGSFLIA